jgi:hypothetical protein
VVSSAVAAPPAITHLYPAGAQRGATVDLKATGTIDASTKVWASGKGVSVEVEKGTFKVRVAKEAVPGTYWLRAFNAEGASGLRPFVVGTLTEVMEKEPNDESKKAQTIEGSTVIVNGKLEKTGDVDCFAVNLKKGQTLVASVEAHDTLRSPMDGMVQVLSADGFVLEENNDFHGLDPQIAFTAPKDGTYIVRVYAFPAAPDASIRFFGSDACIYRLTLTTGPFADHALALAVRPNATAVGAEGWNIGPTTRMLALAPRLGDDSHAVAFSAAMANTLRVRLDEQPVFAPLNTGIARPPFSATARLERPGTEMLIPFSGKKGQALSIHAESRSFGLAVNPVVRVLDEKKQQLARAEPGKLNTDTTLTFTPPADGQYTVGVSDLFGGGGKRHICLVRVLSESDYDLTVTGDRFTISPGKPTTIPVKVNRMRGFNKPVEVAAEGLPDTVKVEIAKPAKPDPNTVTLSLTADKPWSGPFRLVGTVADDPKLTRHARAALPEFEETTADLWLTVTAPAKK